MQTVFEDTPYKQEWKRAAIGISLCPFWWQWGFQRVGFGGGKLFSVGPFRFAWRW